MRCWGKPTLSKFFGFNVNNVKFYPEKWLNKGSVLKQRVSRRGSFALNGNLCPSQPSVINGLF